MPGQASIDFSQEKQKLLGYQHLNLSQYLRENDGKMPDPRQATSIVTLLLISRLEACETRRVEKAKNLISVLLQQMGAISIGKRENQQEPSTYLEIINQCRTSIKDPLHIGSSFFTSGSALKKTLNKFVQDYNLNQPITNATLNKIDADFRKAYATEIDTTSLTILTSAAAFNKVKSARK